MIFIILSLFFNIAPSKQNIINNENQIKVNTDNSNITNEVYKDDKYTNYYLTSQPDNPLISFRECSFSYIVPTSYFSDSSLIYSLNCKFQLNSNNFTQCSFTSSLFYVEGSSFTMNDNEIISCYNFEQSISVCNIIRCLRTVSSIQVNTIIFDDIGHSCRGLYFAECNDTVVKNLMISNANILRNHGNAIMLTSTDEPIIRCTIENCNFINCGESDYVIYSTINLITINQTNITFSEPNQKEIGAIYFPIIAKYTINKINIVNISGHGITFSDEERLIKPSSIRITRCSFSNCKKNSILIKLRGDAFTLSNFSFSELEFDSTLMKIEGNTEIINFESVTFSNCPTSKTNTNHIMSIPENNCEFNFNKCTVSGSRFSSSLSCIYFGRTGRYTFRKTNLISLRDEGIIFSDEQNGEINRPLEIELLDDTSFPMCDSCVKFNMIQSPISNCLFDNLIFQSDLITFNRSLKSIIIESCNFSKCYSSYQGTSIIELPNNGDLEFTMDNCIFNYTHLLSGTAIEILNKVKSVTISGTQFIDIEGDIFIDIDKSQIESNYEAVRITDCSFMNSVSSYDGAAIRISSLCSSRLFEISDCLFKNCKSKRSIGGAISFNAIYGKIQRCTFIDNIAISGSAIYYRIESKNDDKFFNYNGQFLSIEGNIFINNNDDENSLFYFNFENKTNVNFHHNKFFINETLENVYIFNYDEKSVQNDARIVIQNNCMDEINKNKIIKSSSRLEISYESAFQWTCYDIMVDSNICPLRSNDSIEIYDSAEFEEAENKRFYSCSQTYNSQLVIQNSILCIYHCSFTSIKSRMNFGGAIYITLDDVSKSNKPIEIHNCSFQSCSNKKGGAVYIKSSKLSQKVDIQDCIFLSNKCIDDKDGVGAALYLNLVSMNVQNCTFRENKAKKDGAAIYYEYENKIGKNRKVYEEKDGEVLGLNLIGCTFNSNSAIGHGGALFMSVKTEIEKGPIVVDKCKFDKNEAEKDSGGAFFAFIENSIADQIYIQFCSFTNCKAAFGGAVCMFCDVESNAFVIDNCLFRANKATRETSDQKELIGGSALFLSVLNGSVNNCMFEQTKGKRGPIKVLSGILPSKLKLLNEKVILIKNCEFDVSDDSMNDRITAFNCTFNNKSNSARNDAKNGGIRSKSNKAIKKWIFDFFVNSKRINCVIITGFVVPIVIVSVIVGNFVMKKGVVNLRYF